MQNETKQNLQIQLLKWHSEFTQLHVSLIKSDIAEYKKEKPSSIKVVSQYV